MSITGGCRCNTIRYIAEGTPEHHALCHCTECRRSAGAHMVGWALFQKDAVTIEGLPVAYESSPGTYRQFCGSCGTGLFFLNEAIFPGKIDIQSATFDDPDAVPPQAHIQMADAPAWAAAAHELPRFDRYPGA